MANWSKNRVEPSAINGGREFTTNDNLAMNELNAIVNNSFYASEKSAEALEKIDDIIEHEQGSVVTIDGSPQAEWSADFVENEKQKSKNLLGANLKRTHTSNGITYTVNDDGSITMKGTSTWSATFRLDYLNLPAGTYIGSVRNKSDNNLSTNGNLQIHYDNIYNNVYVSGAGKTHTLTETKYCDFELFVNKGVTVDDTVYVQLEKGDTITEYQAYNGAIVHEKDTQRHIITSSLIAGFDVPNYDEYHIVPLVENKKIGHKLTMDENGGVVVGAGVRNILINVSANSYVSAIGYQRIRVYKNNTAIAFKYEQTKDTAGRAIPLDITPFLLDVTEGDVITLRFQTTSFASLQGGNEIPTFMTVEVVE